MKRRTAILIGIVAGLVLFGALAQIFRICRSEKLRGQAETLVEAGDYTSARLIYEMLGDEDGVLHCEAMQTEEVYQEGVRLFHSGDYVGAGKLFSSLEAYKDTVGLTAACRWQEALELDNREMLLAALRGFQPLDACSSCQNAREQISSRLFDQAQALAADFRLEDACQIWQELGSYQNSALLYRRGLQALAWANVPEDEKILVPENRYFSETLDNVYLCDLAYIVLPEEWNGDTRFFVYYPGGRDEEMSVDYLLYYMMNPSPDTMAIFLRQNGLNNMREKTSQAIDLLDRVAAECGLFVQEIVVAGSSLGAYPAMHSVVYSDEDYGIRTDCVLSLDAGSDWMEDWLLLSEEDCRKTARIGTAFYLFESPWVGMNRDGICRMVNTGNNVTMVGCTFDEHVRISLDAMGMGVVDWAVGDRSQPCNPDIYEFVQLRPDNGQS